MKKKFDRAKLSPFTETALFQILAEIPPGRTSYELLRRLESRIHAMRVAAYHQPRKPSKGRKRSEKDLADRRAFIARKIAEASGERPMLD